MNSVEIVRSMQKLAIFIFVLLPLVSSTEKHTRKVVHKCSEDKVVELTPRLSLQIIIHGILLGLSMGFLMPIGILVIRMSNKQESGRRLKIIVYTHAALQIVSLLLVTVATIMSLQSFENKFNNNHQKIGLALYVAIWLQVLSGAFRPNRGSKNRSKWFSVHWLLGVSISLFGIINVYTGLEAYHMKTSENINVWNIGFSAGVAFIMLAYLLQEKWQYIKQSGVILGNESVPVRPTDHETPMSSSADEKKELSPMPLSESC